MRFFLDRNMSPYLARMVDAYERDHTVRHHDDDPRFTRTTTDIEWISTLGQDEPRWIVISADGRILKNKTELRALREARLTFFCMSKQWMTMNRHDYAWKFLRVWPEIVENAGLATSPLLYEVSGGRSYKVDLIRLP